MFTKRYLLLFVAALTHSSPAYAQGPAIRVLAGTTIGLPVDGPLIEGNIGFPVSDRVQIFAGVGRIKDVRSPEQDAAINTLPEFVGAPVVIDAQFPTIYFMGGGRVFFMPQHRVTPMAEAAFGAARVKVDVDASLGQLDLSEEIQDLITGGRAATQRDLFIEAAGGVSVVLSGPFRVEGGYRFSRVYQDNAVNINALFVSLAVEF